MGSPRLLLLLLVMALLAISFSQGSYGRKLSVVKGVKQYARWRSPLHGHQENVGMVFTADDYEGPKANTNPHGGVPSPDAPTSPPSR